MQKTLLVHQVGEILGVENSWCGVQRGEVRVTTGAGAVGLELAGEGRVDVSFVVNTGPEKGTLGETEGVATGESHEVLGIEALVFEVGDESREVHEWGWEDVVSGGPTGRGGVSPP